MKTKAFALTLIFMLLALALVQLGSTKVVSANYDELFPNLSMPIEHVNYTITAINGSLWAKIDGDYPIYVSSQPDYGVIDQLPMVYPMPPNTTNIHVYLADKELMWTNYTQTYPDQMHHTSIGDWWMIYSVLGNVSDFFELKIHYEHPIQIVNGNFLFLYDLNISPYLTKQNNNSTAFFNIQMQTNFTSLNVYSTQTDEKWTPLDFTLKKNNSIEVVSVQVYSEFGKPLLGDLVVEFSQDGIVTEFPLWILPTAIIAVLLVTLFCRRKTAFNPTS
jgi:hypothetical protein